MVIKKGKTLTTKVYRKPTRTGRYLHYESNHPPHLKKGLIQSLHNRATTICQDHQHLVVETNRLKQDLQNNGCPQGFVDSAITSRVSAHPKKTQDDKPLCYIHIPYVKGYQKSLEE
jgi:hypothetical protein